MCWRVRRMYARLPACFIAAMGLNKGDKGDKVGLFLPNAYQTAALFLGSMIGGYVCAPFNLLAQRSQLEHVLAHSDCKVLFTTRDHDTAVQTGERSRRFRLTTQRARRLSRRLRAQ